ncbi:MAG: UPF0158 family protein [Alphaproteobacteria bacterium]|nr:UPF0158 family protein [Alphaproteobacteria bacterium]
MALPVRLRDVVDAMDAPVDGWMAYINRRTGEIVSFSEDDVAFHDDDDGDILPDWQAEMVIKAKEVEASDDFVQLPDKFDIHEYAIMERFCYGVDDDRLRQDLLDAIKGSGAFRRFKGMIRRRGLEQAWWTYRDAAIETIATDFLEMEGIPFQHN